MTARERLQRAYELAFHPALLNAAWNDWERGGGPDVTSLHQVLDWAVTLHQPLPEAPAVSARALRRVARYQATARVYRLPTMLRRFRVRVGAMGEIPAEVPAWMVRDIGLPQLGRCAGRRAAPALLRRAAAPLSEASTVDNLGNAKRKRSGDHASPV